MINKLAISMRARLVAALIALAAIGLVVAAFVTHALLASFLLKRFDEQQASTSRFVYPVVVRGGGGRVFDARGPVQPGRLLPTNSYVAVVDNSGNVIGQWSYNADDGTWEAPSAASVPQLPKSTFARNKPFTVTDKSGDRYRVLVDHDPNDALTVRSTGAPAVAVFATPLRDVDQTLGRLTRVEIGVTGGVLVVLGAVAWFAVGVGLRPLRKMEQSADAIAGGDLSRRVEHPNPRTEVGRLGLSLNTMLGRIEEAFAARAASEERLRRFLADASHELRTPLTSIRGYAELFRRGASRRPDDLEKAMRRIEEESSRMSALVDELLLLARLDQGREPAREPVLLSELAADACDDLRTAAPDRVVTLDADPDALVSGDELQLRQVLANLLGNARVHTPPGAAVDVRVAVEAATVVMEVTDHGPGLPPSDLPHVFDRFYRADVSRGRHQGGAGLGLSIVAAIVQAHGGRVGVLNVPGAGARFRVELPALQLPSDSQPEARFVPAEEPIVEAEAGRSPHERAVH